MVREVLRWDHGLGGAGSLAQRGVGVRRKVLCRQLLIGNWISTGSPLKPKELTTFMSGKKPERTQGGRVPWQCWKEDREGKVPCGLPASLKSVTMKAGQRLVPGWWAACAAGGPCVPGGPPGRSFNGPMRTG